MGFAGFGPRRRDYSSGVGVDLHGMAGNNWLIAGIIVDNPTGAWLKISSIGDFVPPYTQGWSRPVIPGASAIDVTFETQGPAGSASDFIGDDINITILDEPVETSNGQSIAAPGTPISIIATFIDINSALRDNTIIDNIQADQRIRLWGWEATPWVLSAAGEVARLTLTNAATGISICGAKFRMDDDSVQRLYPGGIPWPTGVGLNCRTLGLLAGVSQALLNVYYTEEAA